MSSALCCSDLTWPSRLSRASASSRRLVGDAQDERRGRAPVAGRDLRGLHEAPGGLRRAHDAVGRLLHVGRASAPGACCARRGAGGRRGGGRARAEPLPAAAARSALLGRVRGLGLRRAPARDGAAAAAAGAVVRPAAGAQRDRDEAGEDAAGDAEGGDQRRAARSAGVARCARSRARRADPAARGTPAPSPAPRRARRARARRARARRRDRRRGRPRAPRARRPRRDRGGLTTAHGRPPEVG